MNTRQVLHTIAVVSTAIAVGTVAIDFLPDSWETPVPSAAGLIALIVNTYMGFTTTGVAKSKP